MYDFKDKHESSQINENENNKHINFLSNPHKTTSPIKTKTVFHSNGTFETTLPTGEKLTNKLEDISLSSMYIKELVLDIEDVKGFNIQYIDNTDGYLRNWYASIDETQGKCYLRGAAAIDSSQVKLEYEGTKEDFMLMIDDLIYEASECTLKTATIFQ